MLSLNQQPMSETNQTEAPEKELTPEEIKERRAKIKEYYKDQIETLKLQDEYERLSANIAENQAKAMMNHIRMVQMAQGPKDNPPEEGAEGQSKRKLKTE